MIVARAQVELEAPAVLPAALPADTWLTVDDWYARGDEWHFRQPSHCSVGQVALRATGGASHRRNILPRAEGAPFDPTEPRERRGPYPSVPW